MNKKHKTVTLTINKEKVKVDAKLAPLIKELNKVGLATLSSCQDDDGSSYIIFDYEKIELISITNTPYPVALLRWSSSKPIKTDGALNLRSKVFGKNRQPETGKRIDLNKPVMNW